MGSLKSPSATAMLDHCRTCSRRLLPLNLLYSKSTQCLKQSMSNRESSSPVAPPKNARSQAFHSSRAYGSSLRSRVFFLSVPTRFCVSVEFSSSASPCSDCRGAGWRSLRRRTLVFEPGGDRLPVRIFWSILFDNRFAGCRWVRGLCVPERGNTSG